MAIAEVTKWLHHGEVLAAPTETAYGLLALATSARAVKKVFKIKGRAPNQASAILVADLKMAQKYGKFSPVALRLAKKYWPGPLTLVVPVRSMGRLARATIKDGYIGMRVPRQKFLLKLLKKINQPLTATSANISGQKNLYSAQQVIKQLQKRGLKFLVDGGNLPPRPTSTVVQIKGNQIKVLRTGAIKIMKN